MGEEGDVTYGSCVVRNDVCGGKVIFTKNGGEYPSVGIFPALLANVRCVVASVVADVAYLHNAVDDGVDGKTGHGVNVEFARNVLAMREHRVGRNEEAFANLLVGESAHHPVHNFLFALREHVAGRFLVFGLGIGRMCGEGHLVLEYLHGRHEDVVLHLAVHAQVLFAGKDVVEGGVEQFGLLGGRVVFDDDVFQFLQFHIDAAVTAGKVGNGVIAGTFAAQ